MNYWQAIGTLVDHREQLTSEAYINTELIEAIDVAIYALKVTDRYEDGYFYMPEETEEESEKEKQRRKVEAENIKMLKKIFDALDEEIKKRDQPNDETM